MERIKTLTIDKFTLEHHRYRDDSGFLRDIFEFVEFNKKGDKIHYPFRPKIKVQNYNRNKDIRDITTNYTDEEYKEMLEEGINKLVKIIE